MPMCCISSSVLFRLHFIGSSHGIKSPRDPEEFSFKVESLTDVGRSVIRGLLTEHAVFLNIMCILLCYASLNQCHADYGILNLYIGSVDKLESGFLLPIKPCTAEIRSGVWVVYYTLSFLVTVACDRVMSTNVWTVGGAMTAEANCCEPLVDFGRFGICVVGFQQ